MTNVMMQLKDEGIHNHIVYVDSDSYICSDSAKTVKMSKAEVEEIFKKGMMLIALTSSYVVPAELTFGGSGTTAHAIVKYWAMSSGSSSVAEKVSLYSKEYTAG